MAAAVLLCFGNLWSSLADEAAAPVLTADGLPPLTHQVAEKSLLLWLSLTEGTPSPGLCAVAHNLRVPRAPCDLRAYTPLSSTAGCVSTLVACATAAARVLPPLLCIARRPGNTKLHLGSAREAECPLQTAARQAASASRRGAGTVRRCPSAESGVPVRDKRLTAAQRPATLGAPRLPPPEYAQRCAAGRPQPLYVLAGQTLAPCACRGRQRSRAQAGEDRRHDLQISFADAVFGCSVDIEVSAGDQCCRTTHSTPASGPCAPRASSAEAHAASGCFALCLHGPLVR